MHRDFLIIAPYKILLLTYLLQFFSGYPAMGDH